MLNHEAFFKNISNLSGLPVFVVILLVVASGLCWIGAVWGFITSFWYLVLDSHYHVTNRGGLETSGSGYLKVGLYERVVSFALLSIYGELVLLENKYYLGNTAYDMVAIVVLFVAISRVIPHLPWVIEQRIRLFGK